MSNNGGFMGEQTIRERLKVSRDIKFTRSEVKGLLEVITMLRVNNAKLKEALSTLKEAVL
jgi:hypothetical protein